MGVMEEIRRHVRVIKEKLSAAAIPADALETAHHFLETVVKDVTFAAHGLTKDALNRIKTRLVDILPSLFPAITRKVIDVSYSPPSSSHNSSRCTAIGEDIFQNNLFLSS
ncbi:uncharacterized protein LOC110665729 isoform X3 [Hevea brasiliensis]|uniref:uncharacterized protein LOC110665729 isoform X3 n=1 Tax=Hevea brasiliensis TaxID=3981 RepID=UPI0025D91D23|nr:uncharacterized protein LOC110665729 isoform X3 [Hevea brasiliensis]